MRAFHPSYMFNAPEVTNEYNLLNDFLSNSLLDEDALRSGVETQTPYAIACSSPLTPNLRSRTGPPLTSFNTMTAAPEVAPNQPRDLRRLSNVVTKDKAQATYYMTAADPSGNNAPDERIKDLLDAKYKAGLLRPFNYVKGYARLHHYMDRHLKPLSRQKILRQLDKFRPKFRERMQSLTDGQLVVVEMWFERCLMNFDRVFASMAIPACCWRRTGEIFRGNKEMAELIQAPIENLRDVSTSTLRYAISH